MGGGTQGAAMAKCHPIFLEVGPRGGQGWPGSKGWPGVAT